MRGMVGRFVVRPAGRPSRVVPLAAVVVAMLASFVAAAPALGSSYQQEFAPFAHCPVNTPGVITCVNSVVTSGEFKLGSETVPITKTITLQGGLNPKTHELVGATDGNTLSRTTLTVPGGLVGIEGLGGEVTATAELAGAAHINLNNLGGAGPLVSLPLKVKLDNPFLGGACYIGSSSEPVALSLTDGTTNPPPPNKPISGNRGTAGTLAAGRILVVTGNSLVDNAFAAPPVNGCGGLLAFLIDPLVDLRAGLPAAAGHNTAILSGSLAQAEARLVKAEQAIPQFGRCTKVEGVKEGKTTVFGGRFGEASCATETVESGKLGRYEWTPGPGPKQKFTSTVGKVTLETVGGVKVTCVSGSGQGEITSLKGESIALVLSGCEERAAHQTCQSASAAVGEIRTSALSGELGFIADTEPLTPVAGLDLKPAPPASSLARFQCGGGERVVTGSVIVPVASGKMSAAPALAFKATGGKQIPEGFEGLPTDTLSIGSEQLGLTGTVKLAAEERFEVKARAF